MLIPIQALQCNENCHVGASVLLRGPLQPILGWWLVSSGGLSSFSLHLYYDQSSPPVEGSPQWMSSRKGRPRGFFTRLSSTLYFPAPFVQFPCFSFLLRFPFWRDRFRLQLNNNFNKVIVFATSKSKSHEIDFGIAISILRESRFYIILLSTFMFIYKFYNN